MGARSWLGGFGRAKVAQRSAPRPADEGSPPDDPVNPLDRLTLAQWIWGEGSLVPGGTDAVRALLAPIHIRSATRVLDLAAGLGGAARALARSRGVYVTALERSAEVARRGNAQSIEQGLGRKVPIRAYDPETIELKPRSFDLIFAQYLTFAVVEKERLLREIRRGLAKGGVLVLVDLVLREDGDPTDSRLEQLGRGLPGSPVPWRVSQYVDCLNGAGFDCKVADDHASVFRGQLKAAWERLGQRVDLKLLPPAQRTTLRDEAEPWVERLSLVDGGLLSVARFHAVAV